MPKNVTPSKIAATALNEDIPIAHRADLLIFLALHDQERCKKELVKILKSAAASNGQQQYAQKLKELKALLKAIEQGPLR